jgi:hypothetical protein
MNETDLRDLADYHTELWHKRSGWVSGHNHALTIEKLRKLRELLEREPPSYVEYKFDSKKKIEKTLEERIEESNRMIKKWEKSE